MSGSTPELAQRIAEEGAWVPQVRAEMARVVVGQDNLVEKLLIGLLTNGHVLLEGVPGLAKTLAVKALAGTLSVNFKRFQFTPDLLPADLLDLKEVGGLFSTSTELLEPLLKLEKCVSVHPKL